MKTAVVSGASGGIGLAVARRLILDGYFVAGLYHKHEKPLADLSARLEKEGLGGRLIRVKTDFNKTESIYSAMETVGANFKHIDLLVNNAGIDLYKLLTDTTEKEWDEVFSVNVRAAFVLIKAVLPSMIEKKSGNIINISSMWGKVGAAMETAYSSSKAALIGLSKALSKEVAESGVRVNCILPGVIDTPMNAIFSEEEMKEIIGRTPLKRLGKPDEVAKLVSFLSSDDAGFITGEAISIDGGYAI